MHRLRQAYTRDLPRLVKDLRWLLLIAFALYLAACAAGYHRGETTAYSPSVLPLRLPGWMFPFTNARLWGSHGGLYYFAHNTLRASYAALWGAVSLGLVSLREVWRSGFAIGLVLANNTGLAKAAAGVGIAGTAGGVLLPHGPFEFPAFWLAWALGWRAGLVWIRPLPGLRRWQSAKAVLREFKLALLAVVPLLLVAALLEAYANPFFRDHYLLGIGASPAMAREHRVGRPFVVGEAALSPDGATVAATTISNGLWIWKRPQPAVTINTGESHILTSPAWSQDGRHLAFIQGFANPQRSELKIVDVATRHMRSVIGGPAGRYVRAAWRPREARIGVLIIGSGSASTGTNLWLADPIGGRWERLTRLPPYRLHTGGFSWSPDGRQVVAVRPRVAKSQSTQLWVMNADGTGMRKITDGERDLRPAWSPDGKWIAFLAASPGITDEFRFVDPLPLAQVCLVRPDGSGRRDALAKADDYSTLSWSPDSKQLLYVRNLTAIMGTPKGL